MENLLKCRRCDRERPAILMSTIEQPILGQVVGLCIACEGFDRGARAVIERLEFEAKVLGEKSMTHDEQSLTEFIEDLKTRMPK